MSLESATRNTKDVLTVTAFVGAAGLAGAIFEGAKLGSVADAFGTMGLGTLVGALTGLGIGLWATRKNTVRVEGGDKPIRTENVTHHIDVAKIMERRPHPGPMNEAMPGRRW